MSKEVQPQDEISGLVERKWVRENRKSGVYTERTLEGEQVKAGHSSPIPTARWTRSKSFWA
jgi:hypothetical protein